MMIIFKKEDQTHKNQVFDDYNAYEHFFSIFVHEITNPISSIKMASQLIEKSKVYDSELLEIINNECLRISKVINSISQISSKLILRNQRPENIHEILHVTVLLKLKIKIKN